MILHMAFAIYFCEEVFYTLAPEFEQKAHHTNLFVVGSLLPAQKQLHLAHVSSIGNQTFPEAGWVRDDRLFLLWCRDWRWRPLRICFCALQAYKRAPSLFTSFFSRGQRVKCGKYISGG